MVMGMNKRQLRVRNTELITRDDADNEPTIEGYFAVFNSDYDIAPGMSESIAPGAFTEALSGDVRALVNHDTTLVIGRNKAGTLELKEDSHGLWGKVRINPKDSAAVDLYERVKRGDVDGCSIGFDIEKESTEILDNGDIHWTIEKIMPLAEVSCCTFPAYQETNISARTSQRVEELEKRERQAEEIKRENHAQWKEKTLCKLKGEQEQC